MSESRDVLGPAVTANDRVTLEIKTPLQFSLTSFAEQSATSSLNPMMSPKKMVTHSKWSANVEVSPAYKMLCLTNHNICQDLIVPNDCFLTHFVPLHVPHNRRWEKIVKCFLCLHLFLIELPDLFHHLFGKNLHILFSVKCIISTFSTHPDYRQCILDKEIEDKGYEANKRQDGNSNHLLLIRSIELILCNAPG